METKAHHVLVGLFALILIAGGGVFAVWLGKVSFDEDYAFYDVVFEGPVRGLRESAEVRFNGIQVGEVTSLGLDGQSRVIARVRVLAQTPVRVDSFAQLEPQGLTGLSYILISGGAPDAQRLLSPASRQPPRIFARRAQLEGLVEGSEDVLDAAQLTLFRLSELLSDQNVEEFSATLQNLREITDRVNAEQVLVEEMRAAIGRIDTAASDISDAAVTLQQFGVTADAFLTNEMATAVNETTAAAIAVNRAATDTTGLIEAIQPALESFAQDGLEDMTRAAGELNRLVESMERSASDFENNPGGFIAGSPRQTVEVPQ
ncbi:MULTISPECIES: MlaD family protein [Maricaulis]|uniref:Phospholipid/cholesterol/gamma-HCH transport system substrate-binding protein n=1 Tax=Maricaulis salignorans TaxID=144026 RepID=A0A1G9S9I3_9PROT|nr:MlaD family protein [Maricaulis salignorans]SDM32148.1 phospholipid/cholesterol/gamma-HCH transport system substrate-binding protein [Maricaulis salignorans]|tara:strand:- start:7899 stop:8849 length:951 start_codon:yes stop_codon:yes gene_type:complete